MPAPHAYGSLSHARPRALSAFEKTLVRFGLVASGTVARRVTTLLALFAIGCAYAILASAVPSSHTLGNDVLRPGEVVPASGALSP